MKRFLSIFLVIFSLIAFIAPIEAFASNVTEPYLLIENAEIPVVVSGKENTISFNVKNNGNATAEKVTMSPIFAEKDVFTINNLTSSTTLENIGQGKTVPVKLNLSISPEAAPGDYAITLKFNYNYTRAQFIPGGTPSIDYVSATQDITIYVRVNDKNSAPRLIISSTTTDPDTIVPGQNFNLRVLFENKGTLETRNITAKLEGLKNDGGFYITSGSDVAYIKIVGGKNTSAIDYNLRAAKNIKSGAHELKITFSYNGISETQLIYLNVGGDSNSQSSNLLIENMKYPNEAISPNNNFILKFDLRNNGGINANNILVKVESSDPAVVPKTTNIKRINTIGPSGTESLEFVFSPTQEAISKSYPISIIVEYDDELNQDGEKRPQLSQYVGINVEKSGDSGKGKPKLIIDKYSFNPSLVKAGENFEMTLSFFNTNNIKTIKNIKIFLTSNERTDPNSNSGGGSVFTPVDSSNTFYIDSIPPKGRVEKKITMFTVPDAQAKTYTLIANFEYEDNEGNEYPAEELIGVPVVQQSKLETGELQLYPEAMVGQPLPVSLEFYNTGKVTLYNMMVKLDGDFQTENGSYYVGNFNSGSSEYFEGMVIPSQPGELKGALLFTYEDSTGQMQELRKEFTLNVMEMPPMEEFPGDMPPMEDMKPGGIKGILKSKWLWIILIIIGGVGGFIFYKKKKKAKEMALDE